MGKEMTQEQKINRGTIVIFILSIVLVVCLCATATLAYFAGQQTNNVTLILGGPVNVKIVDKDYKERYGENNLVMTIKGDRDTLIPGIGINMQAIAKLSSSVINPTKALLRAILDIEVTGVDKNTAEYIETLIRRDLGNSITTMRDTSESNPTDGWVQFSGDGYYYYCSKEKMIDEDGKEYITLQENDTGEGSHISFINGTFQFPTREYTNDYSNVEIKFTLTFQAIQSVITNDSGDRIPNTIFNVKNALDNLDWEKHNSVN